MLSGLPTYDVRDLIFSQFSKRLLPKMRLLPGLFPRPRWGGGVYSVPIPPDGQSWVTNRSCPDRRTCFHVYTFTPSYALVSIYYQPSCRHRAYLYTDCMLSLDDNVCEGITVPGTAIYFKTYSCVSAWKKCNGNIKKCLIILRLYCISFV